MGLHSGYFFHVSASKLVGISPLSILPHSSLYVVWHVTTNFLDMVSQASGSISVENLSVNFLNTLSDVSQWIYSILRRTCHVMLSRYLFGYLTLNYLHIYSFTRGDQKISFQCTGYILCSLLSGLKNSTWCPHTVYVFCTDLRTNRNSCLMEH
jgi:hypothetical protein